jgi:hypothetical protein
VEQVKPIDIIARISTRGGETSEHQAKRAAIIAKLTIFINTKGTTMSGADLHTQMPNQCAYLKEPFDVSCLRANATQSRTLPNARQSLLAQLWTEAEAEDSDWNHVLRLTGARSNLLARIDELTREIVVNSLYQTPILPDEEPSVKHKKQAKPVSKHSEPQRRLYHKLKKACEDDYRHLKQIQAGHQAVHCERRLLQQKMLTLNEQIQRYNVLYEIPVDNNLVSSLHLLPGNNREVEVSYKQKRLRRRNSAGKLKLLKDRERRYSDIRVLRWEEQEMKENWFVKSVKVVQPFRRMIK